MYAYIFIIMTVIIVIIMGICVFTPIIGLNQYIAMSHVCALLMSWLFPIILVSLFQRKMFSMCGGGSVFEALPRYCALHFFCPALPD